MKYQDKVQNLANYYKGQKVEEAQMKRYFTPKQLEKAVAEGVIEPYYYQHADKTTGWRWVPTIQYLVK